MAADGPQERMRMSEEKARNWLADVNPEYYDDLESVVESINQSSIIDSSDSESGEEHKLGVETSSHDTLESCNFSDAAEDETYNDIKEHPNYNDLTQWDCVKNELINILPQASFSNISVSNANNIVLGNIIKIKGDLIVNVSNEGNGETSAQTKGDIHVHPKNKGGSKTETKVPDERERASRVVKETKVYRPPCLIVTRMRWLAMDPVEEPQIIQEPVNLVIICHTATTSSTQQATNVGIIRDIQTFHIETRNWSDIGYNFLIGCDGNVYEGRGWGIEGAHTFSYNRRSIGVAFIGCFIRKVPPPAALQACKKLLKLGVEQGHLSAKYKLMAHRQFIGTESPGTKLYEELKTWDNFYRIPEGDFYCSEEDD